MSVRVRAALIALLGLSVGACATTESGFRPEGAAYPPKPATSAVEVFEAGMPARPFECIARLDAHFEKTFFTSTSRETAIEALKTQARAAGADAIIEIREQRSRVGETLILHVTGMGIRYRLEP